MTPEQKAEQAQALIKACYDDGVATIDDVDYCFHKMTHKKRRKVFAYFTTLQTVSDLGFLDSERFDKVIEPIINEHVTVGGVDGPMLAKCYDAHWETHQKSYTTFIQTALGVISYPFLPENAIG